MDTFMVVLGEELQAVRTRRKWTRRDLQRRLTFDVSQQTLATWEQGTRHISAERLVLVCDALGEPAEDLIARVRKRVAEPDYPAHVLSGLGLDVVAAAGATHVPCLGPVQAWARCRLRDHPHGAPVVRLDISTLDQLAEICNTTRVDLARDLARAGLIQQPDATPATDTPSTPTDARDHTTRNPAVTRARPNRGERPAPSPRS